MDEALGMRMIGSHHDVVPPLEDGVSAAHVYVVRRQELDAAVVVLLVVPAEEWAAVSESISEVLQLAGKPWVVFERLEVALRKRVVVAGMRAAEALGDVELREQLRQKLAAHRCAAVGVQRNAPGFTSCLATVSSMRRVASEAFSRSANNQPTTQRL